MEVLVIGASGDFGGAVARELMVRGHRVRALQRPGGRVPQLPGARVVVGDALDEQALGEAARGVDAIVFGYHMPFDRWLPTCLLAAQVTANVAAAQRATILFPGNVYGLRPDFEAPVTEQARREPFNLKGDVRNRMEAILEQAAARGARLIILRAGDYMGPGTHDTWLEQMSARALKGGPIVDPAEPGVLHAWAYLPDVARAGVSLLEKRRQLARVETFHFEGYSVDSNAIIRSIRLALGDPARCVAAMPWWALKIVSPFWPLMRHVLEVRYLWQQPLLLDGTKLASLLPDLVVTPLDEAVAASLGLQAPASLSRAA